jgi:hypothetical protein
MEITEEESEYESVGSQKIPRVIFVVPYRERVEQHRFFDFHMKNTVLKDLDDYEIVYSHQADTRSFNRGAMKNIGFLYAKSVYPNDYKNITFVFNDIDTMPYTPHFLNYETTHGKVKHFYGYTFTLGGIVSITGEDFEKTNGFPNYWAWGYEDNAFQKRVETAGLKIDRSQFYPIQDKNILQLKDGMTKIINRREFDRYTDEIKYNKNNDGLNAISNVVFEFDETTDFLNVEAFDTLIPETAELNQEYDIRNGSQPFTYSIKPSVKRGRPAMRMFF